MKTVWVVNKWGHDFSEANKYGKLVYLTKGSVDILKLTRVYRQIASKLKDSKPNDYILVSGLPVLGMIACSIFAYLHGRLNLIIFHKGTYIERHLEISDVKGVIDDFSEV